MNSLTIGALQEQLQKLLEAGIDPNEPLQVMLKTGSLKPLKETGVNYIPGIGLYVKTADAK